MPLDTQTYFTTEQYTSDSYSMYLGVLNNFFKGDENNSSGHY